MRTSTRLTFCLALLAAATSARAQVSDAPDATIAGIPVNYTESKVAPYTLPDPLKLANGGTVTDAQTWLTQRRPELLKLFETQVYGRIPATAPKVTWEVVSTDPNALNGTAVMKTLTAHMGSGGPTFNVTLYTPAKATRPVPVLLAINFNFAGGRGGRGPATNRAAASAPATARAALPGRGPGGPARGTPAEVVGAGFAYANIYHTSIETDTDGQPNINIARKVALAPGQAAPASDEWGSIAAWAWGMSRFVDYLESDSSVDAKRVAIYGVSRLGKTVLWTAANDPRIALVVASCSGEGGAALARRNYGETVAHLVAPTRYPYQFAGNYAQYGKDPGTMPVDSHELLALIAPRPVLLVTGDTDRWSDPRGEFLAALAAEPVYKLLGKRGPETTTMPNAGQRVGSDLAFFMHAGGHGTMPGDWDTILPFLADHLHPDR
jgi:hypothetical protein